MKTVLLHPGWPKTGTSSLQSALAAFPNHAGLPWDRGQEGPTSHAILNQLLMGREWNDKLLAVLLELAEIDGDLPVVCSDERIIGAPWNYMEGHVGIDTALERLSPPPGWDFRILLTLRDPRSLLRATYRHEVRLGSGRTYGDFLRFIQADRDRRTGRYEITSIVDRFVQRFGSQNIHLAFMEEALSSPKVFWRGACQSLGLPPIDQYCRDELPYANSTFLAPKSIELFLNRHVASSPYRPRSGRLRTPISRTKLNTMSRRLKLRHDDSYYDASDLESALVAELVAEVRQASDLLGVPSARVERGLKLTDPPNDA